MDPLLAALPWALLCLWAILRFFPRPRLYTFPVRRRSHEMPRVDVIVPTHDDGHDIGGCLGSLLASEYYALDITVVDDGSTDGTAEVAAAIAERSPRVRLVRDGEGVPEGWRTRAWLCWRAATAASGDLLLFTHTDTRHHPELLPRAVAALERTDAALVSVLPRHDLQTMAERVLMPHLLLTVNARFVDARLVNRARSPRNALANPQYVLVRREAYLEVGGHEAVRDLPAPELAIAQRLRAKGRGVYLIHGERFLVTRMFRSFAEITAGWTRILAMGAHTALRSRLVSAGPWLAGLVALAMWLVPPVVVATFWGSPAAFWLLQADRCTYTISLYIVYKCSISTRNFSYIKASIPPIINYS
jgi:hypothetical protein